MGPNAKMAAYHGGGTLSLYCVINSISIASQVMASGLIFNPLE
jgi:hypothetical protein